MNREPAKSVTRETLVDEDIQEPLTQVLEVIERAVSADPANLRELRYRRRSFLSFGRDWSPANVDASLNWTPRLKLDESAAPSNVPRMPMLAGIAARA
jgi:hypothetical protein